MNGGVLVGLLLLLPPPDCGAQGLAAVAPVAAPESYAATAAESGSRTGYLLVYSATFPQTLEQSEYRAHTNYTIATSDDKVVEHVINARGSFNSRPARVSLPAGEYHVRAQNSGGQFVTVPVVIEADKTTVVDLDGETLSRRDL